MKSDGIQAIDSDVFTFDQASKAINIYTIDFLKAATYNM
jgi:hypothetical protein